MISKKVILLAIIALPLAGCDSRKPETNASSYTSQDEILDMQEEQYGEEYKEQEEFNQQSEETYNDVSTSGDKESDVNSSSQEKQKEEAPAQDDRGIDNTSSEADDTVY